MKTIGLIGGMSWESSHVYYELLNKLVKEKLGGFHSCKCLMYSVDFAEVEKLQHLGKWEALDEMMANAAISLERGGAEIIILCTNTMHLCSHAIKENIGIPFLHIADATGSEVILKDIKKVGLLGTSFTMEKEFYKEVLQNQYGIEVLVPGPIDRKVIHRVIFDELVHGIINSDSRDIFLGIIEKLSISGAEGIILGCTEIPLLVSSEDVSFPVFDTTKIHAAKAVEWALS